MKNIYLTKKWLIGLIWSLLFGFSFSYLLDIHILNFWEQNIEYKLLSLLSLTIIFTCLCYLIVVNIIFPRVTSIGKFKLYQFIIVCCVFAAAFSAVLPLRSQLPPQWNNLEIIVPESENEVPKNGEVWLTYIVMNGDQKISFDSLRQTGSWKEENGYLIAKSGPASLEYRFRYHEDTEINIEFLSHDRGGKVIVQMENYEKHLDLFENPGGMTLCVVPLVYTNNFWLFINSILLFIVLFLFIFLFNLLWIIYIQNQNNKNSHTKPLVVLFVYAIFLRMILPVYMIISGQENTMRFQATSYYEAGIISQYILQILQMIPAGDSFLNFLSTSACCMMVQAVIDSFGVFLVYAILNNSNTKKYSLWGAFVYSIWLPSIFYATQVLTEAYVPVIMLLLAYFLVKSFHQKNWILYLILFGFVSAVSMFIRFDNALVVLLFIVFLFVEYRCQKKVFFIKSTIILFSLLISFLSIYKINSIVNIASSHSLTYQESTNYYTPSLTIGLYNSLGEYPATYRGIRIFHDQKAFEHIINKTDYYQSTGNVTHRILSKLFFGNVYISTFVTEVIIEKPVLYIDWIIRRLIYFLPSNPFTASIFTFVAPSTLLHENQYGYRFSQVFQGLKYYDYLLFLVFCLGIWYYRKNRAILFSMLSIYLGVLIGHVFTQCGEVYFRNDLEVAYLDPRYLLGMVSIWPVLIPPGIDVLQSFFEQLKIKYSNIR